MELDLHLSASSFHKLKFAPDLLPIFGRQYENNILTGAKFPDPGCYGHTQFHLVSDGYRRDKMAKLNLTDQIEVYLRANGIARIFAWTGAQAMYQAQLPGPVHETDAVNPRKNLCWGTDSVHLYEMKHGGVVGLDDRVLKLLVWFLLGRSGGHGEMVYAGRLKRFGMGPQILKKFYSGTIVSILTGCITAWYGNCLASDHKAL
ncbi:28S ribosomal protein S30, mitochondrial [Salmo trutta]|uniref:28S ribosomal protein S30, mitochondrial n=1 Tax=Salmo trutta TaxID=8032 RepID=UPI0011328E9A|nr:28S ribosomal protein S30, mitochondrial-like [Salmo trutta]